MKKSALTFEQIEFLRVGYKEMTRSKLTAAFNEMFGQTKTEDQIKAELAKCKILSGRNGRFENGNIPWNNNSKGCGLTKANKGTFKKGNIPPNIKSFGAERIDKEGFVWVKVPEKNPYTGHSSRYKLKHVDLWEKKHGCTVPKGMAVAFADGDRTNFDPDNLMLVSRAELLRLNMHGYKACPDELKPSVMALAKLEVKIFQSIKENLCPKNGGA